MRIITATEVSRNFSRILDELERGGEEIVVMRGKHPVAKMVPGALRHTALEVLADLYHTLDCLGENDASSTHRSIAHKQCDTLFVQ